MTPVERFDALVAEYAPGGNPALQGTIFGSEALKVDGLIFAMLVRGRLTVKLPAARVTALVEAGQGRRLDLRGGHPMREWIVLDPTAGSSWPDLTWEARDYVQSAGPSRRGRRLRLRRSGGTA